MSQNIYNQLTQTKTAQSHPFFLSPHAIHTVHPDTLKLAFQEKGPFSIHLCESQAEKEYFQNKGDFLEIVSGHKQAHNSPSAIRYIDDNKLRYKNTLTVHANYVSEEDIAIIKKNNSCVVHCPGSFHYFGHANFPLNEYRKNNIPIALGTDSICSNTELNMITEIGLFLKNHPELTFYEILPMLTTNAAECIGMNDIGKIALGYKADFVTVADCEGDVENILSDFKLEVSLDHNPIINTFVSTDDHQL